MAVRQRIRRQVRRARPKVRRASSSSAAGARMDAKQSMSGDGGLMIGGVLDPAEKAADRMADRVMRMPASPPVLHRKCAACEGKDRSVRRTPEEPDAEDKVRTKPAANAAPVAPGANAAPASPGAAAAVRSVGGGKPLGRAERAFFEPRFNADLSSVRVHDGPAADRAANAVGARAFALGNDITFARGEYRPGTQAGRRLLAHELAHVAQGGDRLQRELIRQPPGRTADPPPMDDAERQAALAYNQARYNAVSTEAILDILGEAGRQAFTIDTIEQIRNWQADFQLDPDGMIGIRALEPLCREMIAGVTPRTAILHIIIDGHNFDLTNVASIRFDRTVVDNAVTDINVGGRSPIRIGPPGFSQGYRGLVHTVRHEIEHADVAAAGFMEERVDEFRAEVLEITSPGMLLEGLDGVFDDAARAWRFWGQMTTAEQRADWGRFQAARDELQRRFDAASAARQATHRAMMTNFATQAAP